jgi:hypothetical protein
MSKTFREGEMDSTISSNHSNSPSPTTIVKAPTPRPRRQKAPPVVILPDTDDDDGTDEDYIPSKNARASRRPASVRRIVCSDSDTDDVQIDDDVCFDVFFIFLYFVCCVADKR